MAYIYTSGTTGPSKAVRCSYRLHGAYAEWFRLGDLGPEDRAMLPLPMFHVAGTGWIYTMLAWGGSIAIVPRFSTDRYWDSVRELGATTGTVMAAMATFLLRRPEQPDDSDNPMRIALLVPGFPGALGFGERFGVELWSGYAMTEVPGPLRTVLGTRNLQSAGQATSPDWEVRLVDDSGEAVADGEVGELLVRHSVPAVITGGYVNMPEATAAAWEGGWFHTGDLLRREASGEHYFVDRNKDALRRRGENVSSFEVEAEIVAHPDVLEATVVGVPSAEAEDGGDGIRCPSARAQARDAGLVRVPRAADAALHGAALHRVRRRIPAHAHPEGSEGGAARTRPGRRDLGCGGRGTHTEVNASR